MTEKKMKKTGETKTKKNEEKVLKPIYEIVQIKQVIRETDVFRFQIRSPKDAVTLAQKEIADSDREVLLLFVLNVKNEVIALHHAHIGSLSASIVSPRELFKTAILNNGASIIIAHNHPSGNATPSPEDIAVTKRVKTVGEYIAIELLDHLIVTPNSFISLKEKGYM